MEGESEAEATLFPATVGEKLRAAREAQGQELADVAANTRIPQRHLEAIEKSNYASLPSITYALGFAKAYARAVGADEVAIARELRGELATTYEPRPAPSPVYDLDGPRRGAPGGIVLVSLIVTLLLAVGVGLYYGTNLFRGAAPEAETLVLTDENLADPANEAVAAVANGGQVALIATDTVWVRVTDGSGNALFEKELKAGERYDVPPDADRPRARVARPDKLQVTLNGSIVPPLGTSAVPVEADVSAAAIKARGQPGASPTPGTTPKAAATPAAAATPRPRPSPVAAVPAPSPAEGAAGNATAP